MRRAAVSRCVRSLSRQLVRSSTLHPQIDETPRTRQTDDCRTKACGRRRQTFRRHRRPSLSLSSSIRFGPSTGSKHTGALHRIACSTLVTPNQHRSLSTGPSTRKLSTTRGICLELRSDWGHIRTTDIKRGRAGVGKNVCASLA